MSLIALYLVGHVRQSITGIPEFDNIRVKEWKTPLPRLFWYDIKVSIYNFMITQSYTKYKRINAIWFSS